MYTLWHVDKYNITFKLIINSRISRRPVQLMPGPVSGRGPAVEKHWTRQHPLGHIGPVTGTLYPWNLISIWFPCLPVHIFKGLMSAVVIHVGVTGL
jgi:hypothetical protein